MRPSSVDASRFSATHRSPKGRSPWADRPICKLTLALLLLGVVVLVGGPIPGARAQNTVTFTPTSGPTGGDTVVTFSFTPDHDIDRFYFVAYVPDHDAIWKEGVIENLPSGCSYENGHTSSVGDYFGALCPDPSFLAGVTYTGSVTLFHDTPVDYVVETAFSEAGQGQPLSFSFDGPPPPPAVNEVAFAPLAAPPSVEVGVSFSFTPNHDIDRFYFVSYVPDHLPMWKNGVISNLPLGCSYENGHSDVLGDGIHSFEGDYFGASCDDRARFEAGVTYTGTVTLFRANEGTYTIETAFSEAGEGSPLTFVFDADAPSPPPPPLPPPPDHDSYTFFPKSGPVGESFTASFSFTPGHDTSAFSIASTLPSAPVVRWGAGHVDNLPAGCAYTAGSGAFASRFAVGCSGGWFQAGVTYTGTVSVLSSTEASYVVRIASRDDEDLIQVAFGDTLPLVGQYTFDTFSGPVNEDIIVHFSFTPPLDTDALYFISHVPFQIPMWKAGTFDNLPTGCELQDGNDAILGDGILNFRGAILYAGCETGHFEAGTVYTGTVTLFSDTDRVFLIDTVYSEAGYGTSFEFTFGSPTPPSSAPRERAVGTVGAGESVSTDGDAAGATTYNPLATTVRVPDGGSVTIDEETASDAGSGFILLDYQAIIDAPAASSALPLVIAFELDASLLASVDPQTVDVFRNGEIVNGCSDPEQAVPDPCVASRIVQQDGDLVLTVRTSAASTWTFGHLDDTAAPVITWLGGIDDAAQFDFGSIPPSPTCSAIDGVSGVVPCAVSGYANGVGTHQLVATAVDAAGNVAVEFRMYVVNPWLLSGFFEPVAGGGVWNTVKAGQTVPLKFRVFAGNSEVTDVGAVSGFAASSLPCTGGAEDPVDFVTTGQTSLRYDTASHQFVQNWRTPATSGACFKVAVATLDGSTISALFKTR